MNAFCLRLEQNVAPAFVLHLEQSAEQQVALAVRVYRLRLTFRIEAGLRYIKSCGKIVRRLVLRGIDVVFAQVVLVGLSPQNRR